jgi:hypothetical protein
MIKKHQTSYTSIIRGAQIFREELDYIYSRCSQKGIELKLSDDDNNYESIDELIKFKGSKPSKIDLNGKLAEVLMSSISITLKPATVIISTYGSEDLYAFGCELNDYFTKRVPNHYKLFSPTILWVIGWSLLLVWFNDASLRFGAMERKYLLIGAFLFLSFWVASVVHRRLNFKVNLIRKHEHGFLKRNSDAILLMIIGGVIGSLITYITTVLSK